MLAVFGGIVALHWLPDGVRLKGPAPYEGLLHVDDEGGGPMTFARAALLRENELLRPQGRQKSELICLEAPEPPAGRRPCARSLSA